MDIDYLKAEIASFKDTVRFFVKINLGTLAALFAFFSFLSSSSNEAIEVAIQFKILIGILLALLALGFWCEYLLVLKGKGSDYRSTLESRIEKAYLLVKLYVTLWIITIFLAAFILISIDIGFVHNARI